MTAFLVALQRINREVSKAVVSEISFIPEIPQLAVQNSSKNSFYRRFSCSTTVYHK